MKNVNPISIRVPAELKQWLEDRSIRNFRSMNQELVAILAALRRAEETDFEGASRFGAEHRRKMEAA